MSFKSILAAFGLFCSIFAVAACATVPEAEQDAEEQTEEEEDGRIRGGFY